LADRLQNEPGCLDAFKALLAAELERRLGELADEMQHEWLHGSGTRKPVGILRTNQ
jgi:hypothetical protein